MGCIDVIRGIEETAADLETNFATARRQVSAVAEQMIAYEYEHQTIAALERTRVSRMEKLEAAKNQAQLLAKQISQAAEFASDLVQRSSSSDIIQRNKSLQERFEELSKIQFAEIQVRSFVQFVSTCEPQSFTLGFIRNRADTVEGLSQNFQAGVEAKIFICPKTSEGEIYKLRVDQVEVLIEPVDQVTSLTINEEFSGNLQVKFVPKVPGAYNITAKINGEKLANSPFKIPVKERQLELVGDLDLQNEALQYPTGVAVNSKGLIALASRDKHCIMIFDKEGKYVRQFGHPGDNPGELNKPVLDVTFMKDDEILVAERGNHRIQQFNVNTGKYVNVFGRKGTGEAEFEDPSSICMDDQGHFVVAEFDNNRVQVLTKEGAPVSKFGDSGPGELDGPQGCVFHMDMFIVSNYHSKCLKLFDSPGKLLRKIGEEGAADGQFKDPWGLCTDGHGNILVCDYQRGVVQQFSI